MVRPLHIALLPALRLESSFAGIARRLGVRRQKLNRWITTGRVPHAQMVALNRIYGIVYAAMLEGAANE